MKIDVPIIQAPIGGAASPALAAAVSNAGALGSITQAFGVDLAGVRRRIIETRELTDRKFAVNMLLMPLDNPQRDVEMRLERLNVYLEEELRSCPSSGATLRRMSNSYIRPAH